MKLSLRYGWVAWKTKRPAWKQAHVVLAQQTHAAIEGDRCDCVLMGNSSGTGGGAEETYVLCVSLPKVQFQLSSLC